MGVFIATGQSHLLWLAGQYGDSIEILEPVNVKEGYRELLMKAIRTTDN